MKKSFLLLCVSLPWLTAFTQQKEDTGFVARNIRNHIISIKMAQLALDRSNTPALKALAREIIQTDRQNLRNLLVIAEPAEVRGPSAEYLDSLVANFRTDSLLDSNDPRAALTSGNTATDSLGSGSSGSGNIGRKDTGTMARTHSNRRNRGYSEQGDYLYRNQPLVYALQDMEKVKGRQFNNSWLGYMLGFTEYRVRDFEKASGDQSNPRVREMAVQALPLVRTQKDRVVRLAKRNNKPAEREDPGRLGPTRQNTPR